ncbi:hypothetical protein BDZ89DRAFT_1039098 [Hymenopellis radicata]|nr:hypothetical protein BDZ89DRAFT_1039098 [Hymenopellis radicata]
MGNSEYFVVVNWPHYIWSPAHRLFTGHITHSIAQTIQDMAEKDKAELARYARRAYELRNVKERREKAKLRRRAERAAKRLLPEAERLALDEKRRGYEDIYRGKNRYMLQAKSRSRRESLKFNHWSDNYDVVKTNPPPYIPRVAKLKRPEDYSERDLARHSEQLERRKKEQVEAVVYGKRFGYAGYKPKGQKSKQGAGK